ncbi:hypothetical protein [Catenuloplanes indicus]|uniref:Uncharacterized protein n=1 Tax=Catenuloplanes indicus TaxID=137267 RepID=A0AAE3W9C6_9ACTN|nr:hypothetical protein [Catenuloplanes indicus]MDQ0370870.1 hypothetical protein [Catenuloplanes indicus]
MSTLIDLLHEDGSWRCTLVEGMVDEAVFRLEPGTAPARRDLAARLLDGRDPGRLADPEQWEAVLIEALLADPVVARLRVLRLHLTDYHHSAAAAARALAGSVRTHLEELYLGYDFTYLLEHSRTSTGGRIEPESRLHDGFTHDAEAGMWEALPALRTLTAEGAFLFDRIGGDSLTEARLRGAVLCDGGVFPASAPALVRLAVELGTDVYGVACPVDQLENELTPTAMPNLRHLDLGEAEFDGTDLEVLEVLAGSPLLPQLESLVVRSLEADEEAVAALMPAFAHLNLSVAH